MEEQERSFALENDESLCGEFNRTMISTTGEFCDEENQSVDELQSHGIGAVDIQKLKFAGICTIKVKSSLSISIY